MHISLCKVFLACVVVTTRVTRVSGSECERGRQCADSRFYDLVRAGCVQCTLVHGTYMCNVHFVATPGNRTLISTEIQIVIHNWHICIYAYIIYASMYGTAIANVTVHDNDRTHNGFRFSMSSCSCLTLCHHQYHKSQLQTRIICFTKT